MFQQRASWRLFCKYLANKTRKLFANNTLQIHHIKLFTYHIKSHLLSKTWLNVYFSQFISLHYSFTQIYGTKQPRKSGAEHTHHQTTRKLWIYCAARIIHCVCPYFNRTSQTILYMSPQLKRNLHRAPFSRPRARRACTRQWSQRANQFVSCTGRLAGFAAPSWDRRALRSANQLTLTPVDDR
jgi:hypothetical protein